MTESKLPKEKTLSVLFDTFRPYRKELFLLGILGSASSVLAGFGVSAVIPLFSILIGQQPVGAGKTVQYITEFFKYLPFQFSARYLLVMIVILFIGRAVLLFAFIYFRSRLSYGYKNSTMKEILASLLRAEWPYLLKQKMGHIHNLLTHSVDRSSVIFEHLAQILLFSASALIFFVFAVMISPKITVLAAAGGAAFSLLLRPLVIKIRASSKELAKYERHISQFISEHLLGVKTVKISAAENSVLQKGKQYFNFQKGLEFRKSILRSVNKVFIEPVTVVFISFMFFFTYQSPDFNFGVFAAMLFLIQRIFIYLEGLQSAWHALNELAPYAELVNNFKKELGHREEKNSSGRPFIFNHSLELKNVMFQYDSDNKILDEVSLCLNKGEIVGFIGPSGAGKTSVADLLTRLFEPTGGGIFLDGISADEFDLKDWRSNIGYVAQDNFLLNDTIEENIRFYDEDITRESVIEAAQKTNIHEFVQGLKDGFKTVVGDRGVMLSGGQRQRIVLARTLARNPQILILDEATSALDNESEALIQNAIHSLKGKVAVFIIAHRLSTVMNADRIFVLEDGKIIEEGQPQDLLQKPESYFYKMHRLNQQA